MAATAAIDPALITGLCDPHAYPQRPPKVEVVQTHISCVFLAGDAVYKVKKPVRFSFLDFSTLESRRHFCDEEVRLNRRLAPAVYRGVVPIVHTPDGYRVGASGTAVEYAVQMERLPPERLLRAVVERGEVDDALLERIAAKIAAFHADPSTRPETTESARPEEIARTLRETFDGLATSRDTPDAGAPNAAGAASVDAAAVRALVATLTAAEAEVEATQRAQQRADARRYVALATRRAWQAQGPVLVVVMGLSG